MTRKPGAARATAAALAAVLLAACPRGPDPLDLDRLERQRDALREKLAALRADDPWLREAPEGNVLIGMPVAFTSDLVREVTAGFLDQVEIALGGVSIHKEGEVTARRFLATFKPGRYVLDVELDDVRALVKPGAASIEFEDDRVRVSLPVTLAEGRGRATVRFQWDSQGVAGAVCEDFEATRKVAGRVAPRTYTVKGAFRLAVARGQIEATPEFPDLAVELKVEPSASSWKAIEQIVEERSLTCRTALKLVDVQALMKGLLEKGIDVKVPRTIFRPIRFPAGLQQSVSLEGREYALAVRPQGLRVAAGVLWYGADVSASAEPAPPPAPVARP